jgi:hypothetical protein
MTSQINASKFSEPIYYHREYKNDVPKTTSEKSCQNSWITQCNRVALVALPFFSLYKPLSFPLSLAMGGMRTFTSMTQLMESIKAGEAKGISYAMMQTTIAVIALAGTIFAHPLGMIITTTHDLVVEVAHLIQNLRADEYKKAMENCLGIMNNALYLTLFLRGGLEIAIASLAMQICIGLYHSQAEFRKGRYVEGVGHLLMSMIRGNQLAGQARILHTKWRIEDSLNKTRDQGSKNNKSIELSKGISHNQQIENQKIRKLVSKKSDFNLVKSGNIKKNFPLQISQIEPSDLVDAIGLPFAWDEKQSFKIDETNINGEAVGTAYLKDNNKIGNLEIIAWYWQPKNGFQVISSKTELLKEYNTDQRTPFQFYSLHINDNGIVAGSFLIDQIGGHNRCPWFWWSTEKGIHPSPIPESYQLVRDINNKGEIAISVINRSGFLVETNNHNHIKNIPYPSQDIIRKKIEKVLPVPLGENQKEFLKDLKYHFHTLNAESIDDNSRIKGIGTVTITSLRHIHRYTIQFGFESVVEGLEEVYVNEIMHSGKIIYQRPKEEIECHPNPFDIPKWVFFIYQNYSNLTDAINKSPEDALILLKYHLYRPDEKGGHCFSVIRSLSRSCTQTSLELIKICLPCKIYLHEHPGFIDELYKVAVSAEEIHPTRKGIAYFLSDSNRVKNCPERDAYFIDWFNYEMQKQGAQDGEFLSEFVKRKNITTMTEWKKFSSKFPPEISGLSFLGSFFWLELHNSGRYKRNYYLDIYESAFRYKLCPPLFYGEIQPNKGIWSDTFSLIFQDCWSEDPRFMELLKKTFPSPEYRYSHPEKLNEYLDKIVWHICQNRSNNSYIALKVLSFLQNEGIDLQVIAKSSKHIEISKFLKEHEII